MGRPRKNLSPEEMIINQSDDLIGGEIEVQPVESLIQTDAFTIREDENFFPVEEPVEVVSAPIREHVEPISLNGWREIDTATLSGMPYFISEKPDGEGVLAYYRRTRAFANAAKRWKEVGKFVDFTTGADIKFEPVYCRNRFN